MKRAFIFILYIFSLRSQGISISFSTLVISATEDPRSTEIFESVIPRAAPANGDGVLLMLGGENFSSNYDYECRFFCDSSTCSEYFFQSAIPPLVKSSAQFMSTTALRCRVPVWPFPASPTNISLWRGGMQVPKDPRFSASGLDIFSFYGLLHVQFFFL